MIRIMPGQYVRRVRELVGQKAYGQALDLAGRCGAEVEDLLSLEQLGAVAALLKRAELVYTARAAQVPAAAER